MLVKSKTKWVDASQAPIESYLMRCMHLARSLHRQNVQIVSRFCWFLLVFRTWNPQTQSRSIDRFLTHLLPKTRPKCSWSGTWISLHQYYDHVSNLRHWFVIANGLYTAVEFAAKVTLFAWISSLIFACSSRWLRTRRFLDPSGVMIRAVFMPHTPVERYQGLLSSLFVILPLLLPIRRKRIMRLSLTTPEGSNITIAW